MRELLLDEIKDIELNLLRSIDEFCRNNQITYYIHAGTLLGAVRHKGFIPWDDDIDICMLREDYNKFKSLVSNENCGFAFICFENEEKYPYVFGKVYDKDTILVESDRNGASIGIYIDVFPIDNLPNSMEKAAAFVKRCHSLAWVQMMASDTKIRRAKTKLRQVVKVMLTPLSKLIGYKKLAVILNKKVQKYNVVESKYVSNIVSPNYMHVYEKEWFKETVRIPFETIEVNAPAGYKKLLQTMYGDYMKLPPAEKRVSHHDFKAYKK